MEQIFDENFWLGANGLEPATPPAGWVVGYFKDDKFLVKNSSGIIAELSPGSVYGQNRQTNFDGSEHTNGDSTPLEVYSFTTDVLPAGKYDLWLQMSYKMNTVSYNFNAKAYIDGVEILSLTQEMKDATNYEFNGGYAPDSLTTFSTDSTHTITIEIWPESSSYIAYIKNIYLKIKRVE